MQGSTVQPGCQSIRDSTADSLFNSGINIVIPSICNCVNVSCHSGSDTISTVNGHANNIIRNILLLKKKEKLCFIRCRFAFNCVREDICMFYWKKSYLNWCPRAIHMWVAYWKEKLIK